MPVPLYKLDDRRIEDLISEMIQRIPGHTPEWTNPVAGDPGRTLIELFAWLADTILYRVNLIPERQRLAFLRLLNIPMRPALAASGIVTLQISNPDIVQPQNPSVYTPVTGPAAFETSGEISVLPVSGHFFIKRKPDTTEMKALTSVVDGLETVYGLDTSMPYITTPVFEEGASVDAGIDIAQESIDKMLWIGLLAAKPEHVAAARGALGYGQTGAAIINIGFSPRIKMPDPLAPVKEEISLKKFWTLEIASNRTDPDNEPEYIQLDIIKDTTGGFSKNGIIRAALPDKDDIGVPENSVTEDTLAGVGDRPPRIDDEDAAGRLVAWIRLRPGHTLNTLSLSWAGVNAVSIDQRKTLSGVVAATAHGDADLIVTLPGRQIETDTFKLQVESPGKGYLPWTRVDNLASAGRDGRVFELDAEAGQVRFGDNLRGAAPQAGMRIRIEQMRYGGGSAGNLTAGNITGISHRNLSVTQDLATSGGVDAETLAEAEKRIPSFLKHQDRAVTTSDYKRLAQNTPGVEIGRVKVLPKFLPHKFRKDIPGVVSVMVIPKKQSPAPPNPRPDRILLERVHRHLDKRRPLSTEMYVIGVEYIQLGLTIAVDMEDGFGHDAVMKNVVKQMYGHLWPLAPGGDSDRGWPLGRSVVNLELLVEAARVEGVDMVQQVNLFTYENKKWKKVKQGKDQMQKIDLLDWQLPELLNVVVVDDPADLPEDPSGSKKTTAGMGGVPIPVVPEVC